MRGRSFPPLRGRATSKPKAWYERSEGVARLVHDRALIAEAYSTLSHRIDDEAERVHLDGVLVYRAACGIPTEIDVRVDFPFDYPRSEPQAYDAARRFPHSMNRHFSTEDGCCCLWIPPKSRWNPQDRNTLIPFLDEVAVFFDRQLVYDASGQVAWPGGQYGHGAAGYKEWIVEEFGGSAETVAAFLPMMEGAMEVGRNDRCPCGSGLKFKRCHGPTLDRVRRQISFAMVKSLFVPDRA